MTDLKVVPAEEFIRENPDSLPPSRFEEEIRKRLVATWQRPEPAPLDFVWEGLIPDGFVTAIIGDGGTGKSFTALELGSRIVLGEPFLGRAVKQGDVLVIDAELDDVAFMRRAYQIARGLGLTKPPKGLHYVRLDDSLAAQGERDFCRTLIQTIRPRLVILDSLSIACSRLDLNGSEDVIDVMRAIGEWGTVLVLDHLSKAAAAAPVGANVRAYGNVFKYNLARSVLQLQSCDAGGIRLTHVKSNFSKKNDPIGMEVAFEPDLVFVRQLELDDPKFDNAKKGVSTRERILSILGAHDEGATSFELATELEVHRKTVQNHLTDLAAKGDVFTRQRRWYLKDDTCSS
ncbi:MAG TPA: AAA family ATPase [Thermoanaerobaculia bacterium]|jgi:DNA-binding CsgD family transcriptional regulator|nr:AAA family ATPase [Thermoanaerobaculia bacterium]